MGSQFLLSLQCYVQSTCLQARNRVSGPVQEKSSTHQCNQKEGGMSPTVRIFTSSIFIPLLTLELQSVNLACIRAGRFYLFSVMFGCVYLVTFPCNLHLKYKYELVSISIKISGLMLYIYFSY